MDDFYARLGSTIPLGTLRMTVRGEPERLTCAQFIPWKGHPKDVILEDKYIKPIDCLDTFTTWAKSFKCTSCLCPVTTEIKLEKKEDGCVEADYRCMCHRMRALADYNHFQRASTLVFYGDAEMKKKTVITEQTVAYQLYVKQS